MNGNLTSSLTGKRPKRIAIALVLILGGCSALAESFTNVPSCGGATLQLTPDYSYFIGSGVFYSAGGADESGSTFRWLTNGSTMASGLVGEDLLLHFDGGAVGANGEQPVASVNIGYAPGKFGSCLALQSQGLLQFSRTNNLHLEQGVIDMWVALRSDGTNPVYSSRDQILVQYLSPNGDFLEIAQDRTSGVLFAGGMVAGHWQSAYGSLATMTGWKAGQWHHLAFVYSAEQNFMRFYLDGVLAADSTQGGYSTPDGRGNAIAVGGDFAGDTADYFIDELRISGRVDDAATISARARRTSAPGPNEVWLPTSRGLNKLVFEFTPATAVQTGSPCQSVAKSFSGVPITNVSPSSALLAPGASTVSLLVQTLENSSCAYSVGLAQPYSQMTPFDSGAGTAIHNATVRGLNPDPAVINDVYVRCASNPDYLLHLQYRALAKTSPAPFPRLGNLWGWFQWSLDSLSHMAKVSLWLGATPRPDQITTLRQMNPGAHFLTSINAIEAGPGLPDDYYLKDIYGNRIEVWPNSYRLNMTKADVADYQARAACQTILNCGLLSDGVFFDNVMLSQSWLTNDIYGNAVQIDANGDGIPDDPATLDAAWSAGVMRELQTFRQMMPGALMSGHTMDLSQPGVASLFNGISIGFATTDVIEGRQTFSSAFGLYSNWVNQSAQPAITMVESAPPRQISYGYGYWPQDSIPPATLEFAQDYYPYFRFGLAFALMNDGVFTHEFGDTWHGNDWWYDELDFNLGYPVGPALRAQPAGYVAASLLSTGASQAGPSSWQLLTGPGCAASLSTQSTNVPADGTCARIDIAQTTGVDWNIDLIQKTAPLSQGQWYDLSFWALSDRPRAVSLNVQKSTPNWDNYGLSREIALNTSWQQYSFSFAANSSATNPFVQIFLGATNGIVLLANLSLTPRPPDIYRRDFTYGAVLMNATHAAQSIYVGPGLRRLTGSQAPMDQFIVDDQDPNFSTTGGWTNAPCDSGLWQLSGPYYHAWAGSLHLRTDVQGAAVWRLPIQNDDGYTIFAWWPAAPQSNMWSSNATYEVIAGGVVIASTNLDQTTNGDQWHPVADVFLSATNNPSVRLSASWGICAADALLLQSHARYNNGQPVSTVRLGPMDGIVLQRDQALTPHPAIGRISSLPGYVSLGLNNLVPGLSYNVQRAVSLQSPTWSSLVTIQATDFTAEIISPLSQSESTVFYRVVAQPAP